MTEEHQLELFKNPRPPQVPSKRPRRSPDVPVTGTGENTSDILGAWVQWCQDNSGVPVPASITARLGKEIKELIKTSYSTKEIKNGLAIWTVQKMDNPNVSPAMLTSIVWKYAMDTQANTRAWRESTRERVRQFSSGSQRPRSKAEENIEATYESAAVWLEQRRAASDG